MPVQIIVSGHRAWVLDRNAPPFLHVLDTASGQVLRSFGRRGQGPGEFVDVLALSIADERTATIWATDARQSRVTMLSPTSLTAGDPAPVKTVSLTIPEGSFVQNNTYHYFPTTSKFLGYTRTAKVGFVIVDTAGRNIGQVPIPLAGDSTIPISARTSAGFSSYPCMRRDGRGFAMRYTFRGRLDLFDERAHLVRAAAVPFPSDDKFAIDTKTGKMAYIKTKYFYMDCTYSSRRLFALFGGQPIVTGLSNPQFDGAIVHEFDLDGRFVRAFRLDRFVNAIGVDASGTILLAVSQATAGVIRFRLPVEDSSPHR
jgi:hypothetical protein